nr:uncharacterized protein LOC102459449 [Pelodiscus sinensis]|eukprot:XP_006137440.2 uncharacterized protein LOC102459449 [Pelodiscus sinensis]
MHFPFLSHLPCPPHAKGLSKHGEVHSCRKCYGVLQDLWAMYRACRNEELIASVHSFLGRYHQVFSTGEPSGTARRPPATSGPASVCYICGAELGAGKEFQLSVNPPGRFGEKEPFFPFLTVYPPAPRARPADSTGLVATCVLCYHDLLGQWLQHESRTPHQPSSAWSRQYKVETFVCFFCRQERKRCLGLKAVQVARLPVFLYSLRVANSLLVDDGKQLTIGACAECGAVVLAGKNVTPPDFLAGTPPAGLPKALSSSLETPAVKPAAGEPRQRPAGSGENPGARNGAAQESGLDRGQRPGVDVEGADQGATMCLGEECVHTRCSRLCVHWGEVCAHSLLQALCVGERCVHTHCSRLCVLGRGVCTLTAPGSVCWGEVCAHSLLQALCVGERCVHTHCSRLCVLGRGVCTLTAPGSVCWGEVCAHSLLQALCVGERCVHTHCSRLCVLGRGVCTLTAPGSVCWGEVCAHSLLQALVFGERCVHTHCSRLCVLGRGVCTLTAPGSVCWGEVCAHSLLQALCVGERCVHTHCSRLCVCWGGVCAPSSVCWGEVCALGSVLGRGVCTLLCVLGRGVCTHNPPPILHVPCSPLRGRSDLCRGVGGCWFGGKQWGPSGAVQFSAPVQGGFISPRGAARPWRRVRPRETDIYILIFSRGASAAVQACALWSHIV